MAKGQVMSSPKCVTCARSKTNCEATRPLNDAKLLLGGANCQACQRNDDLLYVPTTPPVQDDADEECRKAILEMAKTLVPWPASEFARAMANQLCNESVSWDNAFLSATSFYGAWMIQQAKIDALRDQLTGHKETIADYAAEAEAVRVFTGIRGHSLFETVRHYGERVRMEAANVKPGN